MSETVVLVHNYFLENESHVEKPLFHVWSARAGKKTLNAHAVWFQKPLTTNFHLKSQETLMSNLAELYEAGLISLGRASEIAGLPYERMIDILHSRGTPLSFGPETVEEAEAERRDLLEQFRQSRRRR